MNQLKLPLKSFIIISWIILIGFCIVVLTNTYLKEVQLINHSAKLKLLEISFSLHPKGFTEYHSHENFLYLYLLDTNGNIIESSEESTSLSPDKVKFPDKDLRFSQFSVDDYNVLQLEKILRRGRDDDTKQGLIVGIDYQEYRDHEYRAFYKFLIILFSIFGLVIISFLIWRKLQQTEKLIAENEQFIYTGKLSRQIAHEIKNPLGVMQATIDYLKELNDPQLMKAELKDIGNEIQRLNRLVQRIRGFTGEIKLIFEQIELIPFLKQFEEMIKYKYPNLVSSYDQTGRNIIIEADKDQLIQVLLNLIQNACDSYSFESTQQMILLGMHLDKQAVEIFVQDWGKPISPEMKEKLFQPFITDKSQGSGLGLAISKQIISAHNGTIKVSKTDDFKRFSIILPLHTN